LVGVITLTTDFANRDGYAGIMKGVILGIDPAARIVDLAHDLDPGDIDSAAFVLNSATRFFPPGTVHVAVVDPGVGSSRQALAVRVEDFFCVAPDNGVLKWIFARGSKMRVHRLTEKSYFLPSLSSTFHGRDLFAPAAAYLSSGVAIEKLGPEFSDYHCPDVPAPCRRAGRLTGEVIYVDRFGNLVSNLGAEPGIRQVQISGRVIECVSTCYSDAEPGHILALIGSHGLLEIALRDGSAAQYLGAGIGDPVYALLSENGSDR